MTHDLVRTDGTTSPARNRRRGATALLAAGIAAAAMTLSSCATAVPAPHPGAKVTQPALTLDQDTAILSKVGNVLSVADTKRSAKALHDRLSGPALAMRTAELKVAKSRKSDTYVTDLPTSVQTLVVPTSTAWPRVSYAVSTQPEKSEPPRLMALEQKTARSPYTMWGWVRLFPGVTMPTFPDATIGTPTVSAKDGSLAATPMAAVSHYVDVLDKGSKSSFAKKYPSDAFRTSVTATAKKWTGNSDFKKAKGSYSLKFVLSKSPVTGLKTSDGGALVFADGSATEKISAEKGATITPPNPSEAALLGKTKPTNTLVTTYRDVFAVYIPPKSATGSDARVKVLGVEHVPVKVTVG